MSPTRSQRSPDGRMPLIEHIRELRSRLIKSVLAILLGAIVGYLMHSWILHQLEHPICSIKGVHGIGQPTKECANGALIIQGPLSPITLTFKVSLVAGLVFAVPIWSYQLWAFVAPALHKHEKKYGLGFVAAGVPLFVGGAALCYWVFPQTMRVLLSFTPHGVSNAIPFEQFIGFFLRMVIVFGFSFELPLLLVLLNMVGILPAKRLQRWWRMIVFGIFVFAAAAVPTGEPLGMTALAAPMCLLFFAALGLAHLHDRRKERREAADPNYGISPDEASSVDLTPTPVEPARPLDYDDVS